MSKVVDELLGLDFKDLFGGVHTAGKILASAFGAGQLAQQVEQLEAPILPDWAKSTAPSPTATVVQGADYVTVLRRGARAGDTLADVAQVIVVGGKRFDGNGYQHGEPFGKRFSFGFDAPSRVDISLKDGKKTSVSGVDKVIFCGGAEAQTKVSGEVVGWFDWTKWQDNYVNRSAAQNAYWTQQRAAQQSPFLSASQQRAQSGQTLQQALLAEKAARANQALLSALSAAAQTPLPVPSVAPLSLSPAPAVTPSSDLNYQAPAGAETQRSEPMSDDLDVLGEQVLRDLCGDLNQHEGDLGRRGLVPGDTLLGDLDQHEGGLGRRGLVPGDALIGDVDQHDGDLSRRGLFPGNAVSGDLGRRGLTPGSSALLILGEMGQRGLEPGITMLGAEYLYGCDVLGAPVNPPRRSLQQAGIVVKTTSKGRTFTSMVVNRQAKHNPKQTLATLRTVAKRMGQVGQRGITAAKTLQTRAAQTAVKGAVTQRRAVPKMAPAALRRMAEDLIAHGKKLGATASKYEGTLATLGRQQTAAQTRARVVTKVHGFFDADEVMGDDGFNDTILGDDGGDPYFNDILGMEYELLLDSVSILGALGDPVPDPTNPGYMTDGSIDPNYGTGGAGATTTTSSVPGPPDYGAGAVPDASNAAPQPFLDFMPDPYPNGDDPTFYDAPTDADLPLGAVIFDGSRIPPTRGLGNYTVFFGSMPGGGRPRGGTETNPQSPSYGEGSGYRFDGYRWTLTLQEDENFAKFEKPAANPDAAMIAESKKNGWGPLIGAPTFYGSSTPNWTKGLRFSPSGPTGGRWFWFYDMAPDWAKQSIMQARLNDAIVSYQAAVAAGKTDFVNQQIQDQLDAQDAAVAAKAQALVDAQVLQQQEVEQQRQAEAQARVDEQQAALDLAAQQQTQQFQAQQDAAASAYLQQHPETLFMPVDQGAQQEDGGGGDGLPPEMSDQGASDDMTPMNLDDQQINWDE